MCVPFYTGIRLTSLSRPAVARRYGFFQSIVCKAEEMNQHIPNLPTIVYTSESQVRSPRLLLRAMWSDLKASRELAWRLFVRDVSAQYRQSLFGIVWAFIPPIITSVIFIFLQSRNVISFGETDIPYPVYVLIGVILWQLFTESLNAPLKAVTASRSLLAKINFPREALVISAIYLVLFNLLIKLAFLAVIFLIFGLQFTWGLLLTPMAMLMLLILGIGLGLLLTPLGMLYTDIGSALLIATQLLFFVTPVVYPPPEVFPMSLVVMANPISPLLIAARDLITTGAINNSESFILISMISLLLLLVAFLIFRLAMPIIIERMSA
jgi:lipopolysaccharide transport system permease protein